MGVDRSATAGAEAGGAYPGLLVRRAHEGDLGAFEALYRMHVGRVHALARRLTGDATSAEELTQEAFLRAWRRLGMFRGDSTFATWLHRLTVNLFLDGRRRASAVGADAELEAADREPTCLPRDPAAGLDLERAIAALRATLLERRVSLDPHTLEVVEANLRLIDEAAAAIRRGLAERLGDPGAGALLMAVRRQGIELLQPATQRPGRARGRPGERKRRSREQENCSGGDGGRGLTGARHVGERVDPCARGEPGVRSRLGERDDPRDREARGQCGDGDDLRRHPLRRRCCRERAAGGGDDERQRRTLPAVVGEQRGRRVG